MKEQINPRNKITDVYEKNPRHVRRYRLTINWLTNYDLFGECLDCGDRSQLTTAIEKQFNIVIKNTQHDLDIYPNKLDHQYDNIFIFEVIEHLLNPLLFMEWVNYSLKEDGKIFMSTPLHRINILRNKKTHFHEFYFNELEYLIYKAGFKILDKKKINSTSYRIAFRGLRPFLRWVGFDRNILLCLSKR